MPLPRSWLLTPLICARLVLALLGPSVVASPALADPLEIRGRVVNATGEPIAQALIELQPIESSHRAARRVLAGDPGSPPAVATVASATDGRFRLLAREAGDWRLVVRAEGHVAMRRDLLALFEATELPALTLLPDVGLELRLATHEGAPPRGAWGTLREADPEIWRQALHDGWRPHWRFGPVDAMGRLRLPRATGEKVVVHTFAPNAAETVVPLVDSDTFTGEQHIALAPALPRSLRILDPAGHPAAEVVVLVGSRLWPVAQTDTMGRVVLPTHSDAPTELMLLAASGDRRRLVLEPTTAGDELSISLDRRQRGVGFLLDPDERPIVGGQVALTPAAAGIEPSRVDFDRPGNARSDAEGRFLLDPLPSETFDLHARAPGFAPITLRGLEPTGETSEIELGTLILAPGVTLAGRVVDPEGRPLVGATIHVDRDTTTHPGIDRRGTEPAPDHHPAAETDADGRFVLADLGADERVDLRAHQAGYMAVWLEGVAAPATDLRFVLEPTARVRGTVVDADGQSLVGARVTVASRPTVPGSGGRLVMGRAIEREATTLAEGDFEVIDVPPGEATIRAMAEGFAPGTSRTIEVPASREGMPREVRDLRLVLERGAVLEGRVLDAEDDPVAHAMVGDGEVFARCDDAGEYRLEGLPPGPTEILASHPDHPPHRVSHTIELGAGRLDLHFPPGRTLEGRVVDADGQPVSHARVTLAGLRPHLDLERFATTSTDGVFRLGPLPPGAMLVRAEREGWVPSTPRRLEIGDHPTEPLVLVLGRGATVRGRVLGLTFDQLARVRVSARDDGGRTLPGTLRYDGEYAIEGLGAGEWLLRAVLGDGRRQAQRRLAIESEPVGPPWDLNGFDLELEGGLELSGQVLWEGEPASGARVSLTGLDVDQERATVTDHTGRFQLADLDPGEYRLGVADPRRYLIHNQILELPTDRHLELALEAGALDGRVSSARDGQPIAGALIVLERRLDGPEVSEFMVTGDTDIDGRFDLPRVPAGAYRLVARHDGHALGEQEVSVADGVRTSGVSLELEPTQGLALEVRLASGAIPQTVHLAVLDPTGHPFLTESRAPDAQGNTHFPTVPAGVWTVEVAAPGAALTELRVSVPGEPVTITLPTAGHLRVRVPALEDSHRTAELTLATADGHPFRVLDLGGRPRERWPVVAGRALVDGLPTGTWILQVSDPDGVIWQTSASTSGSGLAEVVLD